MGILAAITGVAAVGMLITLTVLERRRKRRLKEMLEGVAKILEDAGWGRKR